MSIIDPQPCPPSGGGGTSDPGFDVESNLLCDVLPDGTVVGSALAVFEYDAETGLPVGAPNFVNPTTGAPYVVQGTLQPCTTPIPDLPIFAGFVCDQFGGAPAVPSTPPTCPGSALAVPPNLVAGSGMTEAPVGTFTPTSATSPTLTWQNSPNDDQHGICSVKFTNDAGTGDDPFWQLVGDGVDINNNSFLLDAVWITAVEAALGVGDASDIPAGSSATVPLGGMSVTITFDGPSPHSQMFAGNGAFFIRENDADGQAAGITLDFNPPIKSFRVLTNVGTPSPGSISAVQEAQAVPGTAATPAQPAGTFQIKQFRNPDGTTFYENLDGSPHAVLGAIGECGESFEMFLCDATGTQFLRRYLVTNGAVTGSQDYDLDGVATFAIEPVSQCAETLATYRHTPAEVLCWTETANPANVVQFLRRYLVNQDGVSIVAVIDTLLNGSTPFVASNLGTVGICCCASSGGGSTSDVDFVETLWCVAGLPAIRHVVRDEVTSAETVTWTRADGTVFIPTAPQLVAAVPGACSSAGAAVAVNSQHRLVADADAPWMPGTDVVGTLLSVTFTVLTGTATVVDSNGTSAAGLPSGLSATWSADDPDTLTSPQSIDAIGGSTYVIWTQK